MSLELSKQWGSLEYDRRGLAALLSSAEFPSDRRIWNISLTSFCYWLKIYTTHYAHPKVTWATQLSIVDGPLDDPGISTLASTDCSNSSGSATELPVLCRCVVLVCIRAIRLQKQFLWFVKKNLYISYELRKYDVSVKRVNNTWHVLNPCLVELFWGTQKRVYIFNIF